jgi:Holliday junction DNA helicase RuvB
MFDILDVIGITSIMDSLKERLGFKAKGVDQITPVKYDYRPQNLDEYIGQARAKERIKMCVEQCLTLSPVHFLISGTKGHGKTTLALIIAKMLDFNIFTYVGNSFTKENLKDFLVKNADSVKPNILFIDEIHGLNKELADYMLPLIEQFVLPEGGLKIRPFILIGATTDKNQLAMKCEPFVDRCASGDIRLEHYLAADIKAILKQYNDRLYHKNVEEETYDLLSVNTRYNPRTALALFKDFLIVKDMKKVLDAHRIIKDSLTTDDILILKHLAEIDKPVGVEVLAIIVQQTRQDYQALVEPFLLQQGYISRTARGRIITLKGKTLLQEIK